MGKNMGKRQRIIVISQLDPTYYYQTILSEYRSHVSGLLSEKVAIIGRL